MPASLSVADLEEILRFSRSLWEAASREEIVEQLVTFGGRLVTAERLSAVAVEVEEGIARVLASSEGPVSRGIPLDLSKYPELVLAATQGQVRTIEEVGSDPALTAFAGILDRKSIHSVVAIPLARRDRTSLCLLAAAAAPISSRDLAVLQASGEVAAAALRAFEALAVFAADSTAGLEDRYRRLFDEIPTGALQISEEGAIRAVSRSLLERLGVSRQEALASPPSRLLAESSRRDFELALQTALRQVGRVVIAEVVVAAERGGWPARVALWRPESRRAVVCAVFQPAGAADFQAGGTGDGRSAPAPRDLTTRVLELEEENRKLREQDSARHHFISAAAHELKTPIAILTSYAEALTADLSENLSREQVSFLNTVRATVLRLDLLVSDMLDLAALEAGAMKFDLRPHSAEEIGRRVVSETGPLAEKARIKMTIRIPAEIRVVADEERLIQVLTNLVVNALKYTQEDGLVELTGEASARGIEFRVRDNGPGIPPEDLPYLFEEFRQVARGSRRRLGTGLGLSICKKFTEAMNGEIEIQSRPQQGTTAIVSLPRAPA